MSESKNIDRLLHSWHIFQNNREIIKLADIKIRYLFLVSSVTATYVLSAKEKFTEIHLIELMFMILFVVFLAFAFLTIKPREGTHQKQRSKGFIFHKNISAFGSREEFSAAFHEAEDADLLQDLHYQIYELSKIADLKYKYYQYAFLSLSVQLLLFFVAMMR